MLSGILTLIGVALAAGTIIYLATKLTISFLKTYKKRKQTKLLAANVRDLVRKTPSVSLDDLDDLDDDDVILAEYDMEDDELVQDISIAQDVDRKVDNILRSNGGIVVFD